jgi:chloramphenicol 3-O phosphotransferase
VTVSAGSCEIVEMTITVVLNGTSSAGKTSIAEAIRAVSPLPWQISGIDSFLALVPDTMFAAPGADAASEGFTWVTATVNGVPCWDVVPGAQALGFARAVHQYWAASAAEGFNQVIDHVLLSSVMAADLTTRLSPHRPLYVGVRCPSDVIDERERQRGDRVIGQGRGIASHVHSYVPYDLEVDTSVLTSQEAAHSVLAAVDAAGLTG